jgi:hypothetical protein
VNGWLSLAEGGRGGRQPPSPYAQARAANTNLGTRADMELVATVESVQIHSFRVILLGRAAS